MNVAIVGIGIHPFGRHDGISGLDMGTFATRQALRDAGVEWSDAQFAFGGSLDYTLPGSSESNPDALVSRLGLTGLPFVNVQNGCATAGSALAMAANTIESGAFDLGVAIGFDKHGRGAFAADPGVHGLPSWYGEVGLFVTTQFFAQKINRYMHEYGISIDTLASVAAKAFRNGARNPNAWRRKPLSEEEILSARMLNWPLTQYMLCSPSQGAVAVVLCRADHAHRYTDRPIYLRGVAVRTRRFGSFEVFSPYLPIEQSPSPTVDAAPRLLRAGRDRPHRPRRRAGAGQRVGRRDHAHGRMRTVRGRRTGSTHPRRRDRDRRVPADQHRRWIARQR